MTPLQQHFDAYVEGDLRPEDEAALSTWLLERESHIDDFVRESFSHWQLSSLSVQKNLHDDVMAAAPPAAASVIAQALEPALSGGGVDRFRRWRGTLAVAAALVFAVAALWAVYSLRPTTVAQLSKTSPDARWSESTAGPTTGTLLRAGQSLRLTKGRATATLVSGARVILDGAAEIRLDDGNQLWLESGRIGVEVPVQATGLIVDSPVGRFVDLGTDFTIDLNPAVGCELHVFSGMVELTPHRAEDRVVRVSMGSAIALDSQSGNVRFVVYDEGQRLAP